MSETLYIDANEPTAVQAAVKHEINERSSDITCEIKGLKTGDFLINDTVIERKTASDFVSSITDHRLSDQTDRMLTDFDHQYILLGEGNPYQIEHSNIHPNSVAGMLTSLSVKKDINIVPYHDLDTLGYTVWKIAQTHLDDEDYGEQDVLLKKTRAETEDTFVAMLSCIDGISQEKAEEIADRWDNMWKLSGVAMESPDEVLYSLKSIDGIGEKLAQRIIDSLR